MEDTDLVARHADPAASTPSPTAAHALLDTLLDRGITHVFGLPGGTVMPLYDALGDRPALRVITARHETAAVFAAMGFARATGRPAVVLVTSGPGFTNALTGLAAAYCEGLPVIVIAGDVATPNLGRFALQDGSSSGLDVLSMARPITRWCTRVERPSGMEGLLHRAVDEATGPSPGPVFLAIPIDVGRAPHAAQRLRVLPRVSDRRAGPGHEEAAQLLAHARTPAIIMGCGARSSEAGAAVVELAERTGAMVASTAHAKGAFPERHRSYLGLLGFGGHATVRNHLRRADVTLVVGSRLGDIATNGWSDEIVPSRALIQIDREPSSLGRNYDPTLSIVGDAAATVRAMVEALPRTSFARPPSGLGLDLEADRSRADASTPIKPQWLMATLERGLPVSTIFTVDIGEHAAFALHHLRVDSADKFHMFTGLGSMGSGLCSAIGMKLANPGAPVVSIVGDGGLAMHAGELLTCVDHEIPVMFVVLNDGRYRMVDAGLMHMFGRRSPGLPTTTADLAALATACGAVGVTISTPRDLDSGRLAALLALKRPVLLDVRIDPTEHLSVHTRLASLKHFAAGGAR